MFTEGKKANEMNNKVSITALIYYLSAEAIDTMQSAFSYSELEKLLEKHGFLIYELLTPDDIQRDVIDKAGADMKAFEHVNYCLAVRKD